MILLAQITRYFLFAGGAYWYFWIFKKTKSEAQKIQKAPFTHQDIVREISYSLLTAALFAGILSVVFYEPIKVYTKIYSDISTYGWAWFTLSLIVLILIHDTYFYWMHRLMHHQRLYKITHKIHHDSKNPTPFAAFSFHPLEALAEIIWMLVVVFLIPLHHIAIIIFSIIALMINVIGHLGIEIYPLSWKSHRFLKYLNRSKHHNDHHRYFKNHYGLYFNWWDRWMGTFEPNTGNKADIST